MLLRLLFYASLLLLVLKLFFRTRLRDWGRKLDHAVNAALIAIAVVYLGYFAWQLFTHGTLG